MVTTVAGADDKCDKAARVDDGGEEKRTVEVNGSVAKDVDPGATCLVNQAIVEALDTIMGFGTGTRPSERGMSILHGRPRFFLRVVFSGVHVWMQETLGRVVCRAEAGSMPGSTRSFSMALTLDSIVSGEKIDRLAGAMFSRHSFFLAWPALDSTLGSDTSVVVLKKREPWGEEDVVGA